MAHYTATLIAVLRQRYEDSDQTVPSIASEFLVCERSIYKLAADNHWKRRKDRKRTPRDIPVAMQLLAEAKALAVTLPPQSGGEGRLASLDASRGGGPFDQSKEEPPTHSRCSASASVLQENGGQRPPMPSPPRAPRVEGGEQEAAPAASASLSPADLLEARVRQEIEALGDGGGARHGFRIADAERRARTLATLTQTLHALQRLRDGTASAVEAHYDDDMPVDADAFRDELARRIDAFIKSRSEDGDAVQR